MRPTIAIRLAGVPVEIAAPDPADHAVLARCYRDAPVSEARAVVRARLQRETGGWTIDVAGRDTARETDPVEAIRRFNHELTHGVMLRAPSLFFVHAGVVGEDDRAIVLPGLSRAGKSTLVLALLTQGASYLSDELLVFDPVRRLAMPFPRAVKVRDETVGYFSAIEAKMVGAGEGRFIPATEVAAVADPVPVGLVIAPRWHADGDDELRAVSRGEAVLQLAASTLNFGTHRAASVDHLAAAVESAAAFTLTWRDPHRAAARIIAALRGNPPVGA